MRKIFWWSIICALAALLLSGTFSNLLLAIVKSRLSSNDIFTERLEFSSPFSVSAKEVLIRDGIKLSNVKASPSILGKIKIDAEVFDGRMKGEISFNSKQAQFSGLNAGLVPQLAPFLSGTVSGYFEEAKALEIILRDGAFFYEKIIPRIDIDLLSIKGDLKNFNIELISKAGELRGNLQLLGFKIEGSGVCTLTELGIKDVAPWLAIFGGTDLRANQEFFISVLGSLTNPVVKVTSR